MRHLYCLCRHLGIDPKTEKVGRREKEAEVEIGYSPGKSMFSPWPTPMFMEKKCRQLKQMNKRGVGAEGNEPEEQVPSQNPR